MPCLVLAHGARVSGLNDPCGRLERRSAQQQPVGEKSGSRGADDELQVEIELECYGRQQQGAHAARDQVSRAAAARWRKRRCWQPGEPELLLWRHVAEIGDGKQCRRGHAAVAAQRATRRQRVVHGLQLLLLPLLVRRNRGCSAPRRAATRWRPAILGWRLSCGRRWEGAHRRARRIQQRARLLPAQHSLVLQQSHGLTQVELCVGQARGG